MTRRQILLCSLAVSAALHAALLAIAPMVSLLRPHDEPPPVLARYRVNLAEAAAAPMQPRRELPEAAAVQPRPQDIAVEERIVPQTNLLEHPAPTPDLAARITPGTMPPLPERPADPIVLAAADARIVEISREAAREDLSIERRLVRPSPQRVLPDGAAPTLRAPLEDRGELLAIPASPEFAAPGLDITTPGASMLPPPFDPLETAAATDPLDGMQARLPFDQAPRERLEREIEEDRPYDFMDDLVAIELETYVPDPAQPGYFRLRILPRSGATIPVLPKDMTVVIDSSRSIMQRKLDLTGRGLAAFLEMLRPDDRFNIVVFRDTANAFRPARVPATPEAVASASSLLAQLESRGTTDIYSALEPLLAEQSGQGRANMIVVLSDAQPTAGIRDGRAIINGLTAQNRHDTTILAYGGGNTVNRNLLDLLAHRNKGVAHVTENMNRIAEDLPRFLALFNDPVLIHLDANFSGVMMEDLYPRRLPDFFKGRPVTVYGRFDAAAADAFAMRLTGDALQQRKEIVFRADFETARTGDQSIANEWAFHKAYHLIGRMVEEGEQPALVAALRSLSNAYGIRTSYDP